MDYRITGKIVEKNVHDAWVPIHKFWIKPKWLLLTPEGVLVFLEMSGWFKKRNIVLLSEQGEVKWRIQKSPRLDAGEMGIMNGPYSGMELSDRSGEFLATNISGIRFRVSLFDGKVLEKLDLVRFG